MVFHADGRLDVLNNKPNVMVFGGVLLLFGFTLRPDCGRSPATETLGMQWTRLKLMTFEGFAPDKRQRIVRLFGSALSICTVIGVAWSLVDEEGLGWQDHMSRTFPTPKEAENLILVRH